MFVDGPPGTIGPDGKPTETVTEENYFFRLSDYQSQLIDLIESGELAIQPEVRKNEVLSFLRGNVNQADSKQAVHNRPQNRVPPGLDSQTWDEAPQTSSESTLAHSALGTPYVPGALKDLSISRSSFKWGIPVPGDEKHVIYVWLDALANYMTAIGYGSDDPADQAKFEKYWPADLHLVGKEIIRFHCVYWPAFLLAAGLPLPKAITAHGWLLFEDSKMSKSRGNIVRTETILDAFGTLCPHHALRQPRSYDLSSRSAAEELLQPPKPPLPPNQSRTRPLRLRRPPLLPPPRNPLRPGRQLQLRRPVQRYNSDLANGYGNLVSRTLNMIEQYSAGVTSSELPESDVYRRRDSAAISFDSNEQAR